MARKRESAARRYAAALVAVVAATFARMWLDRALHGDLPFATYFAALAFAAWYGGLGPALVALTLGAGGAFLFVPSFATSLGASPYGVGLYLVVGVAMIAFSETLRRAQVRAEAIAAEARLQQARLEEAVRERTRVERRVAAQHAATRVLAEAGTLAEAAPRILAAICDCLGWEWGALWVVDGDADVLRCVDAWHPARVPFPEFEAASRARTFVSGIGLPGRVWRSAQPVWIPDVVEDTNFPRAPIAVREGLHGALGFPILLGGAVLGVLEFFSREIREPDVDLHGMLLSVGSQIGQFMERKEAEKEVRESEARKSAILEAALDCIVSMDARGRITEFNPAAEQTFGYRRAEVLGRPMAEVIIPPALRERHIQGLEKYLESGEGSVIGKRLELTAMRSDGSEFPVDLAITRIASAGDPTFTGHLRDITERKRAEAERQTATRRWEFLAQASAALASTLDYEETLGALARLVVPFIADWCTVDVLDGDGTVRRLAVTHADPAGRHPRTRVLRTGRSVFISEVTDDVLARITDNPEQLRVMLALGYRSAMIVALTARGQTLGALTLATAESGRRYEPGDLAFGEELARRAAIAVDNARLYRDAQEASRMKDEFLATVSHELRTPLQAMLGWVGVLRQGKATPERRIQALDIIERAGRAQAKLIEDLLDVSRIVTGRLRLDVRATDLASVIEDALDAVRPAADAKDVTLTSVLDRTLGTVAGDPVRLQQVVSNLLSNAVKFTSLGGRAEIRLERSASEARIVVTDTGKGMPPDFLLHAFEPFRQAEAASRRREGGLGLGLAIVRRVVELHGGRVEARSEGEGRGTEMVVTLPFGPPAAARGRSG